MARYIVRRLLAAIPLLIFVSVITFLLMHAVPGGPFSREKTLPPAIVENLYRKYHLDDPLWKQYADYMSGILLHFDFGPSYTSRSRTVNDIFRDHLPVSLQLGTLAGLIAFGFGIPLGVIAALKHNGSIDRVTMFLVVLGLSIPNLALGPLLIWVFALKLDILPVATWGSPLHVILPAVTLSTALIAYVARLTRASVLEVIREDYIRTARAKGLSEWVIVWRHALKNALIPVITWMGPIMAVVLTGTFVVEVIFAVPGLGRFFVLSILARDYPVIMGTTLLFAASIIVINLIVDIAYAFLNPRIRYT